MTIELIADHLKAITGLNSCSVGILVIEQAANKRMKSCNIKNYAEYYRLLQGSKDELDRLIDQVMIPETWFFRGREAFQLLREYLLNKANGSNSKYVRILSIPCATGEEPYSIAIVLKECGYHTNEYTIDAVDIARESLKSAKKAIYTEHSFREFNAQGRDLYFEKSGSEYRLCSSIKNSVNFWRKNIFDIDIGEDEKYNIIFCRNLLIYFDKKTQHKTIDKIASLISDDGVLFIGPGEAGCISGSQFKKIDRPNAFAFIKTKDCRVAYPDNNRDANRSTLKTGIKSLGIEKSKISARKNKTEKLPYAEIINEAVRLADEGDLDGSMNKCKEAIQSGGISADVLCLLGVIHDAKGEREEAVGYYLRAVNLAPDHYQSLMHLASHAERNGDKEKAMDYRLKAGNILPQDINTLSEE